MFIYGSYGAAAVCLGLSFVFLAQADSAYGGRREIARQNGSENEAVWRCRGADECARMSGFREDQFDARVRWGVMLGSSVIGAIAGTVFLLDPPAEAKARAQTRVVPAVSHQEAGLQLQGTF